MEGWEKFKTVAIALNAVVIAGVGVYFTASIQREQLILASNAAASQERIAQSRQATDLLPHLLSNETRKRELALRVLKRAVSTENYSEILAAMATKDPDSGIRAQAIKQLGRVRDRSALEPLQEIANDATKPQAERESAKQSSTNVASNYEAVKACDLNGDGRVDGADVQIATNQALGSMPCTTADLTTKGRCTVEDVQRVANAALGQPCVVTR